MRRSWDFRWLTVGLLVASWLSVVGWVLSARSTSEIHACVNSKTGASRVVSNDAQCGRSELLFTGTK
jgi:hypothetical protein